jgi:hypothetical protein
LVAPYLNRPCSTNGCVSLITNNQLTDVWLALFMSLPDDIVK